MRDAYLSYEVLSCEADEENVRRQNNLLSQLAGLQHEQCCENRTVDGKKVFYRSINQYFCAPGLYSQG